MQKNNIGCSYIKCNYGQELRYVLNTKTVSFNVLEMHTFSTENAKVNV